MGKRTFAPGFRLSPLDVVVLIAGAVGAFVASGTNPWFGIAIAFVVGHFFLFCNVLRMPRPLELVWAAAFCVLAAGAILLRVPSWPLALGLSLAITISVACVHLRHPSYHGVGWRTLNPRLPQWWAQHIEQSTEISDDSPA